MGFIDKLNQFITSFRLGAGNTTNTRHEAQKAQEKRSSRKPEPSKKQVQSLSIDMSPVLNDPKIRKILVDHANESSKAIESVPEQYRGRIAKAALDNFYGTLPEGQSLLAQLQAVYPMPSAEALEIARDLSGKLTSRLNQARQEAVGITEYIWRTVTKICNHSGREGKKFKWKIPPPGGHPGQAHLCSCFAEPVIHTGRVIRTAKKR